MPLNRREMLKLTAGVALFDGKTLDGWLQLEKIPTAAPGWAVKDGAMVSTGSGRGVIYSAKDYSRFRLSFTRAFNFRSKTAAIGTTAPV